MSVVSEAARAIIANVERVILGKRSQIELLVVAALCQGHVLIDDVPGTGKTMLARSFAASLGVPFRRLQCTPDLLPNDVTGVRVFDPRSAEFRFEPGPVFTSVLLADEVNRATPRTQAALLEAMGERQVTVDGQTHPLPEVFVVLATQNPVEFEGTFPLPEAQLDRFLVCLAMGYPGTNEERSMVERIGLDHPIEHLGAVSEVADWTGLAKAASLTHLDPELSRYLVALVSATRGHEAVDLGASPRASLALAATSRALAAVRGRDYVLPDDIKELALPVLGHRLVLSARSRLRGMEAADVVTDILSHVAVGADP
ncbi:MAG TPA: MoxR family ATPase [Acidimicrobiia bacterium]|nr:MoxR family ATPase [Acidimicrobiia bacterium]